jgi:hypothetical protein
MRVLRNIWRSLCNLWYWLPVIWGDRQWDSWYFLKILEHKLAVMERFFASDKPMCVGHERRASEIKYCRLLAARLIADDYLINALKPHEEKYGVAKIVWGERHAASVGMEIAVPALQGKEREREKRDRFRLYEREQRQREHDHHELFREVDKHIRDWWD